MIRRLLWVILLSLSLVACSGQSAPPPPAVIPVTPSTVPTQASTATPIPTLAPLPTAIPTDAPRTETTTQTDSRATLRFIHAHPTLEGIDIYANDGIVGYNLRYGRATQNADILTGDYQLILRPAGTRPDSPALAESELSLNPNDNKIIILIPNNDGVEFITLDEDTSPTSSDTVRFTLVHALTDMPQTALQLNDSAASNIDSIAYRGVARPVTFIPNGETDFTFAGLAEPFTRTLRTQTHYTLVLAGTQAEPLLIATDWRVPVQTTVYFANAAPEIGNVDVYINDHLLFEDMTVSTTSDTGELTSGEHTVKIFSAGDDPATIEPLMTTSVRTNPDQTLIMGLVGPASSLELVTYQDENRPTNSDEFRITYIYTLPEPAYVDEIRQADAPVRISYARPITRTYPAEVPTSFDFVANWESPEGHTQIDFIADRQFEAGNSYIVFIMGGTLDGNEFTMIERTIGAREQIVLPTPAAIPAGTYAINTLPFPVQVIVDGALAFSRIEPNVNSPHLDIQPGTHNITITHADTLDTLYQADVLFELDMTYTLLIFGDLDNANYSLLDFPVTAPIEAVEEGGAVRMINASLMGSRALQLGYTEATTPDRHPTERIANGEATSASLPPTANRLNTTAVSSSRATLYDILPAGRYDFYVYDPNTTDIWGAIYDVEIGGGNVYDIVTTANGSVLPLQVIAVAYPKP